MSRSGYSDDCEDQWQLIRWRGAVASAIRGRRGQAFLKEMLAALDALPEKKLIRGALQDAYDDGAVCALGAVGRARGLAMEDIADEYESENVAARFQVTHALACEVMWMNDDHWWRLSAADRYVKMRRWIESEIIPEDTSDLDRWVSDGGRD